MEKKTQDQKNLFQNIEHFLNKKITYFFSQMVEKIRQHFFVRKNVCLKLSKMYATFFCPLLRGGGGGWGVYIFLLGTGSK